MIAASAFAQFSSVPIYLEVFYKLISPSFKWYVLFFYVLNFVMVSVDLAMYIRNCRLDKMAEEGKK